jgi:hypothetical protein
LGKDSTWMPWGCHVRIKDTAQEYGKMDFFVLGDIFIRKYYPLFDHDQRKIAFACSHEWPGCRVPEWGKQWVSW